LENPGILPGRGLRCKYKVPGSFFNKTDPEGGMGYFWPLISRWTARIRDRDERERGGRVARRPEGEEITAAPPLPAMQRSPE